MGNVNSISSLTNSTKYKPNQKLKQMDHLLSLYYQLKGKIYFNDGMGRFTEWCLDKGYGVDAISRQLKHIPEECTLTEFDPHFPTSNGIDYIDRKNEIFEVIRHCWHEPTEFYVNIIQNRQSVPNTYILSTIIQKQHLILYGYVRHYEIPIDVINVCGLFFVLNKQTLCTDIEASWWKPKSVQGDVPLCLEVYKHFKNNEHFIAYQTISMIINNYDYHNHSNQIKAQLYLCRGLVAEEWNSLQDAENDMKLATELHCNCFYIHCYVSILFKRGKYEEALKYSINAIKMDTSNVHSNAWCASIYKEMNDLDNALLYWLKCVQLEPNNIKYILNCVHIYAKQDDYYNTKKYCLQAIHLDPANSEHYFLSAELLQRFEGHNDANKYYLKAIELNSTKKYRLRYGLYLKSQEKYEDALYQFITTGDSKCLIECAHLYEEFKHYDNANIYYLKAIQMDEPTDPIYIFDYADFLLHQERYQESLQQFMMAIRFMKYTRHKAECASLCADCFLGLNDLKNATTYFLKAIDKDPTEPKHRIGKRLLWAHYYFGLLNIYNIQGNNHQANVSMEKALELCPTLYKSKIEEVINRMNKMKKSDHQSVAYHEKFEEITVKSDHQSVVYHEKIATL